MNAIGMIEFRSIARGIETADTMMKTSNIKLILSQTICPGKYIILITGDTSSVTEAVNTGLNKGTPYIVSYLNIANIDEQVIKAIEGFVNTEKYNTVGILEYYDISDAIIAADTIVKTTPVQIIEIRMGYAIGGKAFLTFTGELSEVKTAVSAAKEISKNTGMLMESAVISAIDKDVYEKLF